MAHGKKKRNMPAMKYPRKKMVKMQDSKTFGTSAGYPVNAGLGPFCFYSQPKDVSQNKWSLVNQMKRYNFHSNSQQSKMKTDSVGTVQRRETVNGLGPLKEKRMTDWLEWDRNNQKPMTVIPLQNVACYLDETEIHKHFRRMFDAEIQRVRGQFEKYLEETELIHFSISNFWHQHFRVEGENDFCGTEAHRDEPEDVLEESMQIVDDIVNESRSSSLEVIYFSDYPQFESEVEVRSSPDW